MLPRDDADASAGILSQMQRDGVRGHPDAQGSTVRRAEVPTGTPSELMPSGGIEIVAGARRVVGSHLFIAGSRAPTPLTRKPALFCETLYFGVLLDMTPG